MPHLLCVALAVGRRLAFVPVHLRRIPRPPAPLASPHVRLRVAGRSVARARHVSAAKRHTRCTQPAAVVLLKHVAARATNTVPHPRGVDGMQPCVTVAVAVRSLPRSALVGFWVRVARAHARLTRAQHLRRSRQPSPAVLARRCLCCAGSNAKAVARARARSRLRFLLLALRWQHGRRARRRLPFAARRPGCM